MQTFCNKQHTLCFFVELRIKWRTFTFCNELIYFFSTAILCMDRKGFTGKKVEFQNIPYSTILNFSTESCGSFDTDSELKLTFATPWFPNLTQDFRSGKADIVAIQNLIAAKTLGPPGQPSDFANDDHIKPSDPGSMEKLYAFINENHLKVDPKVIGKLGKK